MTEQECKNLKPGDFVYSRAGKWEVLENDAVNRKIYASHLEPAEGEYTYDQIISSSAAIKQPLT